MKNLFYIACLVALLVGCGKDGSTGPQGPQGEQGPPGSQGIPGKEGAVIHSGTGVPAGTLGNVGDMYLDRSSSNLYGPKTSSGWGTALYLKGQNGATGATGATGAAGVAGSKMLSGVSNPVSTTGTVGDYYLNKTSGDLFGPKTATGWGTPINLKGTANVVASTWINYNWNYTNTSTRKIMKYTIPTPIMNAVGQTNLLRFYNSGAVLLVYGQSYGGNRNFLFDYEANNGHYSYSTDGSSTFYMTLSSINGAALRDIEYDPVRGNKFRYVMIPAGVQLTGSNGRKIEIDQLKTMSYEQVGTLLNWED